MFLCNSDFNLLFIQYFFDLSVCYFVTLNDTALFPMFVQKHCGLNWNSSHSEVKWFNFNCTIVLLNTQILPGDFFIGLQAQNQIPFS